MLFDTEGPPHVPETVEDAEQLQVCETVGIVKDPIEPSRECASCCVLQNEKRQLKNTVVSLPGKLKEKRDELTKIKKKLEGRPC